MAPADEKTPQRAIVKRRWAIIPGRGGRAVILAAVGAIALGSAAQGGDDPSQPSGQPDSAISSGAAGPES